MVLNITGRQRNYIFLAFLIITAIIIAIALSAASRQNDKNLAEYQEFQKARYLITERKFDQAEQILSLLVQKYPGSHSILWEYGYSLANNGNPAKGSEYMEKALALAPVIKTYQKNLVQYGQVLFELGNYDRAEKYFRESKKYNTYPELTGTADQYMDKIQAMKKNLQK